MHSRDSHSERKKGEENDRTNIRNEGEEGGHEEGKEGGIRKGRNCEEFSELSDDELSADEKEEEEEKEKEEEKEEEEKEEEEIEDLTSSESSSYCSHT